MINVANKELCEELKQLSDWSDTTFCWNGQLVPTWWPEEMRSHDIGSFPAYELGYLLRKIEFSFDDYEPLSVYRTNTDTWAVELMSIGLECEADTPEDAACKVAIELFKRRILTK